MDRERRRYFRDSFRNARAKALGDAEAFGDLLFALERFGSLLSPKAQGFYEK